MKHSIIIYASQYGSNEENIRYIRNNIKSQIPAHLYDEDKIFHLRGAIDYSTMGIKHKLMMKFMHSCNQDELKKLPLKDAYCCFCLRQTY
jgi:hypothetical protein